MKSDTLGGFMSKKIRILVGYDGSSASDDAIDDLEFSGLPSRADAIVLNAADVPLMTSSDFPFAGRSDTLIDNGFNAISKEALDQARFIAKKGVKRLKSVFPLWRIKEEATLQSSSQAIVNKAVDWKADLVVVGAHGHSQAGRFIGSISQLVLIQSSCSVRVGRESMNIKSGTTNLILALDSSPGASAVVKSVLSRSWPKKTHIHIVSALVPHLSPVERMAPAEIKWMKEITDEDRKRIDSMVEGYAQQLRKKVMNVSTIISHGDPKHIIVREAEAWNADCIIMGARRLSQVRRFFLGSVSMAVAARAHCSVEIVRS